MKCSKCGGDMNVDTSVILTCNPPKYRAECKECGNIEYPFCYEVPFTSQPIVSREFNRGWECPKCGAVMSPDTKVCVNCTGVCSNKFTSKCLTEKYVDTNLTKSWSTTGTPGTIGIPGKTRVEDK